MSQPLCPPQYLQKVEDTKGPSKQEASELFLGAPMRTESSQGLWHHHEVWGSLHRGFVGAPLLKLREHQSQDCPYPAQHPQWMQALACTPEHTGYLLQQRQDLSTAAKGGDERDT